MLLDQGPIPAVHGVVRWRQVDLVQWVWEEFRIRISVQTLSRELRALGNRYNRWSTRRIWQRIFEKMVTAGPVPEELCIDSSYVKAHRSAAGSKRGTMRKRLGARAAEERAKSMLWPMIKADRSPLP